MKDFGPTAIYVPAGSRAYQAYAQIYGQAGAAHPVPNPFPRNNLVVTNPQGLPRRRAFK